jgi:hypothetical protein
VADHFRPVHLVEKDILEVKGRIRESDAATYVGSFGE